jgi:hypothetical protein
MYQKERDEMPSEAHTISERVDRICILLSRYRECAYYDPRDMAYYAVVDDPDRSDEEIASALAHIIAFP